MFLNPLYNPEAGGKNHVLFPDSSIRHMRLWTGYYCRWNPRMRPQDCVRQRQTQVLAIKEQFRSKVESLKRELEGKRKTNHDDLGASGSTSNGSANDATSQQQPASQPVPPPNPMLARFESAVHI